VNGEEFEQKYAKKSDWIGEVGGDQNYKFTNSEITLPVDFPIQQFGQSLSYP